jgi:hypothetical protein
MPGYKREGVLIVLHRIHIAAEMGPRRDGAISPAACITAPWTSRHKHTHGSRHTLRGVCVWYLGRLICRAYKKKHADL